MGLTYDGITYRSLEEQVRYDAEQVKILKQADVTINENLQNVNTEINGKLTKPTNPSAESAVTMLADGTVGTKPLSEIGGVKLYLHKINISHGTSIYDLFFYSSKGSALTLKEISSEYGITIGSYNGEAGMGTASVYIAGTDNIIVNTYAIINNGSSIEGLNERLENPEFIDTYIEV